MTNLEKDDEDPNLPSVMVVVPLYKLHPNESTGFVTVQGAARLLEGHLRKMYVVLYDNSPARNPDPVPENVSYIPAGKNEGLSGPYNLALKLALRGDYQWLLTLDQDTRLPQDFLLRILAVAARFRKSDEIGAIVPQLVQGGRLLSPVRIRSWGVSYLPRGFVGLMPGEIHAFNSASLFRVSALKQIGGFSREFWLDYQDAYVYRLLHRTGKRVYVAGDLQIEHNLSTLSSGNLNPVRYRNFLEAESAFHDLYAGHIRGLFVSGRLLGRWCRQWKQGRDTEARRITAGAFTRRIFQSRGRRIQNWRRNVARLFPLEPEAVKGELPERRPTVSVCMATYNGERYVAEQLRSILSQLAPGDEVVVADDASRDHTIAEIEGLNDSRIRIMSNEENVGVLGTFERAIRASSGEILFLSDQDDIWAPKKVARILDAFHSHPDVMLIATDNALIDEAGTLISPSYFAGRGKFRPGLWANLMRNRFGGCTMAFRAELISDILPFPHQRGVLHDIWIGVRTSLSGYRSLYINEPLVLNRRHSSTATGRGRLSLKRKMQIRLNLMVALAEFSIRRRMTDIGGGRTMRGR